MTMTEESPTVNREFASNTDWPRLALCKGDDRFISREVSEAVVQELIEVCNTCPVIVRCRLWAEAQTQPVGFSVAGGLRWKAWNHCTICGKKVRGVDRCPTHADVGRPIGTITAEGQGREYRITDEH